MRTGKVPAKLLKELRTEKDYNAFGESCEAFGILRTSIHWRLTSLMTLFEPAVIDTLREAGFGAERAGSIDEWEADPAKLHIDRFLSLVESIGKGRFAQRLATRIGELDPPAYIAGAINFVVERV